MIINPIRQSENRIFEITVQDAPVSTPAPRRIQHGGRPNWKEDGSREVGNGSASKYSGLTRLAYHYNREFSASQHHAYGCNCMMVGGLPLVDTNFGPPGIGSPQFINLHVYSVSTDAVLLHFSLINLILRHSLNLLVTKQGNIENGS